MVIPYSPQLTEPDVRASFVGDASMVRDRIYELVAGIPILPTLILLFAAVAAAAGAPYRGLLAIVALVSLGQICFLRPLVGCLIIVFAILFLNAEPVTQFLTPADTIASYFYHDWNQILDQEGLEDWTSGWLQINTIEVLLLAVALGLARRAKLQLTPEAVLVLAFVTATIAMFVWGIATGGELQQAVHQVRPFLALAAVALLLPQAARDSRDLKLVFFILVLAAALKALEVIWIFFFIAGGHFSSDWRSLVDHDDSVFFVSSLAFFFALFIYDRRPASRVAIAFLSTIFIVALLVNLRRAGYAALGLIILLAPAVMYQRRWIALLLVGLLGGATSIYLALFWNANGTLGMPAQKLRSSLSAVQGSEDYYSNTYRVGENVNLWQTIIHNPLGTGFGKPFELSAAMDDISDVMPDWQYHPHNALLGLWCSLGSLGFLVFLGLVAAVMTASSFAVKQTPDPLVKAISVFCVLALAAGLFVGTLDQFISSERGSIFIGILIGIGSVVSALQGRGIGGLQEIEEGPSASQVLQLPSKLFSICESRQKGTKEEKER